MRNTFLWNDTGETEEHTINGASYPSMEDFHELVKGSSDQLIFNAIFIICPDIPTLEETVGAMKQHMTRDSILLVDCQFGVLLEDIVHSVVPKSLCLGTFCESDVWFDAAENVFHSSDKDKDVVVHLGYSGSRQNFKGSRVDTLEHSSISKHPGLISLICLLKDHLKICLTAPGTEFTRLVWETCITKTLDLVCIAMGTLDRQEILNRGTPVYVLRNAMNELTSLLHLETGKPSIIRVPDPSSDILLADIVQEWLSQAKPYKCHLISSLLQGLENYCLLLLFRFLQIADTRSLQSSTLEFIYALLTPRLVAIPRDPTYIAALEYQQTDKEKHPLLTYQDIYVPSKDLPLSTQPDMFEFPEYMYGQGMLELIEADEPAVRAPTTILQQSITQLSVEAEPPVRKSVSLPELATLDTFERLVLAANSVISGPHLNISFKGPGKTRQQSIPFDHALDITYNASDDMQRHVVYRDQDRPKCTSRDFFLKRGSQWFPEGTAFDVEMDNELFNADTEIEDEFETAAQFPVSPYPRPISKHGVHLNYDRRLLYLIQRLPRKCEGDKNNGTGGESQSHSQPEETPSPSLHEDTERQSNAEAPDSYITELQKMRLARSFKPSYLEKQGEHMQKQRLEARSKRANLSWEVQFTDVAGRDSIDWVRASRFMPLLKKRPTRKDPYMGEYE